MTRSLGVAALLALGWAAPIAAQATGSQANLVFGIAASHYSGRSTLWSTRQGLLYTLPEPPFTSPDTVNVSRDIDGGIGLMFYGMYYPSATFGFSGEIHFLGTQYSDRCSPVFITTPPNLDNGPNVNPLACDDIDDRSLSTSTVLATAGVVARAWARQQFSPYVRLGAGVGIISRSSIDLIASRNNTLVRIYDTGEGSSLTVSGMAGAGFTFRLGNGGYQLRTEVRDNMVGYRGITSATEAGIVEPPTDVRYKHIISIVVGFEIVLEKSRGRRY